jgi:hypothetical protein
MKNLKPIAAVVAAVALLLTVMCAASGPEERAQERVVAALHDYEVASKYGTKTDQTAAHAFLLQALKAAEGLVE